MIVLLWGLFRDYVVRSIIGRAIAVVILFWIAWAANNSWQRSVGAGQVIESSQEQGKKANERNEKVRAKAKQPGSAERLLHNSCRDC